MGPADFNCIRFSMYCLQTDFTNTRLNYYETRRVKARLTAINQEGPVFTGMVFFLWKIILSGAS